MIKVDRKKRKKLLGIVSIAFLFSCITFFVAFLFLRVVLAENSPDLGGLNQGPTSIIEDTQLDLPDPGLQKLDPEVIRDSLMKIDFACSDPEVGENQLIHWVCWHESIGILREIYFFSQDSNSIDFIDANIIQINSPSDATAIEFLTFVDTLTENSETHSKVDHWIAETLPSIEQKRDLREVDFDGIHYRLYGTAEARSLEIGVLPNP